MSNCNNSAIFKHSFQSFLNILISFLINIRCSLINQNNFILLNFNKTYNYSQNSSRYTNQLLLSNTQIISRIRNLPITIYSLTFLSRPPSANNGSKLQDLIASVISSSVCYSKGSTFLFNVPSNKLDSYKIIVILDLSLNNLKKTSIIPKINLQL